MTTITLSSLAWVTVIILQALFHFVIGPRLRNKADSGSSCVVIVDSKQSSEPKESSVIHENRPSSGFMVNNIAPLDTRDDAARQTSYAKMQKELNAKIVHPDERDSVDDKECRMQQDRTTASVPASKNLKLKNADVSSTEAQRTNASPSPSIKTGSPVNQENVGFFHQGTSSLKNEDQRQMTKQPKRSDAHACYSSSSGSASYNDEDSDNDDCIDDDEEWRYQLIQEYYSSSSRAFRTMTQSTRPNSELGEEDDPALQPVGTINFAKLNFTNTNHTPNSAFEAAPMSIMASIQCI